MDLKKIQAHVSELPDINSMTKSELLDFIIESIDKNLVDKDILNRARYSIESDFYAGMLRGYNSCQQIIYELKGRMNQEGEEIFREESAASPKKYFSAQEVSKMTPAEVRENYTNILNSMKKWK